MHWFILLTLLHKSETCLSNYKSESIGIPRSFSHELDVIHAPSRCTSMQFFVLSKIWHLPGLFFIWLLVNQEKCILAFNYSSVITPIILSDNNMELHRHIQRRIKWILGKNGPEIRVRCH